MKTFVRHSHNLTFQTHKIHLDNTKIVLCAHIEMHRTQKKKRKIYFDSKHLPRKIMKIVLRRINKHQLILITYLQFIELKSMQTIGKFVAINENFQHCISHKITRFNDDPLTNGAKEITIVLCIDVYYIYARRT